MGDNKNKLQQQISEKKLRKTQKKNQRRKENNLMNESTAQYVYAKEKE